MLGTAITDVYRLVEDCGNGFRLIAYDMVRGAKIQMGEAAAAWEPIRNMLITLPLPLILFGVLLAFFIRSFRKPEKVLKADTVKLLEARGRSTRGYLRFWRVEMALATVFVLAFTVFAVVSLMLAAQPAIGSMRNVNGLLLGVLVAYMVVLALIAFFGREVYFGKWGFRFIPVLQKETRDDRSGSDSGRY